MKKEIHPKMYDVVFIDTSTGAEFISQSTTKTKETKKIDGKEYYIIKVEISSDSHPFYTGKQKLVDTAGRVDKFMAKMKKAQALNEKKVKKVKDEDDEEVEETVEEEIKKENEDEVEDEIKEGNENEVKNEVEEKNEDEVEEKAKKQIKEKDTKKEKKN